MKKAIFTVSALLAFGACSSHVVTNPSPLGELIPVNEENLNMPYHIGAGDKLEIKFFTATELNTEALVRPDGRISVMFAQDIKAAGLTPEQLAERLRKKLKGHVKKPELVVTVKGFGSQRVYVGGEVLRSGPIQLQGRNSLIQVLMEAGWITPLGSQEEIIIVRRNESGKESVYRVNAAKIVSDMDTGQDVMILSGDVILVPPLGSVDVDRWIDRNMRQVIPIGVGASYNYTNYYNGNPAR